MEHRGRAVAREHMWGVKGEQPPNQVFPWPTPSADPASARSSRKSTWVDLSAGSVIKYLYHLKT